MESDPEHPATSLESESSQICPLCQTNIDTCKSCSPACPLSKNCSIVSCPHCGYSFPRPSGFSALLSRWFSKRKEHAECQRPLTLAHAGTGQLLQVCSMGNRDADYRSKFAAFGILEGSQIRVRQRKPTFVIEAGETTLALDKKLAEQILVSLVDESLESSTAGG